MGVFTSKRPVDPNEVLTKLVDTANSRKATKLSVLESAKIAMESKQTSQKMTEMDKQEAEVSALESSFKDTRSRRNNQLVGQGIVALESKLVEKGFNETFNQILFEMAFDSYWLDDVFKAKSDVKAMYETFLEIKDSVDKVLPMQETTMISNMKEVIMEACKKAAKRTVTELKDNKGCVNCDDIDNIDFQMDDDETSEMDGKLNDLGKEEIEQLVKDKVLSVVQDEQKAGEAKAEMFKAMDDQMKPEDTSATDDDENTEDDTVAKESYNATVNRNLRSRFRRGTASTLFESIMMFNTKSIQDTAITEGVNVPQDKLAPAVLTSTLFHYTVLETFNVLKLYDMSNVVNVNKVKDLYKLS